MSARRGYPWVFAPRFHLPTDWAGRLLVSAGIDRREGVFVPRLPWRQPLPEELSGMGVLPGSAALPIDPDEALSLFCLPQHLMQRWWGLLSRAEELGGDLLGGFAPFASAVRDFLAYKGLDVSAGAVFDLVVNEAGQTAAYWDQQGRHRAGLGLNNLSWVWGAINLSDESISFLVVNVTLPQMRDVLGGHSPEGLPATPGELAAQYLSCCPDQPVLRVSLAPGEGLRLPARELVVGRCTLDREDPDVTLLIRNVVRTQRNPRERARRAVQLPLLS